MQPMRPPGACRPPAVGVARKWTWVGRGGHMLPVSQTPPLSRHARVPTTLPLLVETSHAEKRCTAMALAGSINDPQPCTSLGNAGRTRLVSRSTACPGPAQAHPRIRPHAAHGGLQRGALASCSRPSGRGPARRRTPVGTWHASSQALLWGWAAWLKRYQAAGHWRAL
jgi:hypothetical protein